MKKITYLFLFLCFISLSSCFEIVEQVFLKNNGSGNFQFIINLSQSKTKINTLLQLKTINGHDIPTKEEIEQKISTIEKTIAKTPGISNVKTTVDFDNYIATINFNFNKLTRLNAAIKNIGDKEHAKTKDIEKTYMYDPIANTFIRLNKFSIKEDYNTMSSTDKEIFAAANYTSIYKFESNISAISNKEAKISPSKKGIMLKQNILDLITNKKSIENKITLLK